MVRNANELESPVVPLQQLDRLMDDFANVMRKMENSLRQANEYYQAARACRDEAAERMEVYTRSLKKLAAERDVPDERVLVYVNVENGGTAQFTEKEIINR